MAFIYSNKYGSTSRIAGTLGIGNKMGNTIGSIMAEKNTCCGDPATPECCAQYAAMKYVASIVGKTDIVLRDLFSSSVYNELWTNALDIFYSKKNDSTQAGAGIGVNKSWSPLVTTSETEYVPTKVASSEKADYYQYANAFGTNAELGNNINDVVEGNFVPFFEFVPENLMNLNTINTRFNIYSLGGGSTFDGILINVLLIKRTVDDEGGVTFTKEAVVGQINMTELALGAGQIYEYNRSLVIPNTVYAKVSNVGTFNTEIASGIFNWAEFKEKVSPTVAYNTNVSWFFGFELASEALGNAFIEVFASITNRYASDCDGCISGNNNAREGNAPCTCASITEDYSYWSY